MSNKISDQLKYFSRAVELNDKNKDKLKEKKCHFRGSFGGVSLISLQSKTPELGVSKINLAEPIDALFERLANLNDPERATPEKIVQASLIYALKYGDSPEFWSKLNLQFLTSELRLDIPENSKHGKLEKNNTTSMTNDILAIDHHGALWIIELKSEHAPTELMRQLNDFKTVIENQPSGLIAKLVNVLNQNGDSWDGKSFRKMIIWPAGATEKALKTISEDVVVIGYRPETFEYEVKQSE